MNHHNQGSSRLFAVIMLVGLAMGSLLAWGMLREGAADSGGTPEGGVGTKNRKAGADPSEQSGAVVSEAGGEENTDTAEKVGPRRNCSFRVGESVAYDVSVKASTKLDLGQMGLGGSTHPRSLSDAARSIAVDAAWHLEMQALETGADGSIVLAARMERTSQKTHGAEATAQDGGDISPPFLVRMNRDCSLAEFARLEDAQLLGARTQQALMLSLQWQYPLDPQVTRYTATERDATGTYRARYALLDAGGETAVGRKFLSYESLHRPDATAGSASNLRVGGKGLVVYPGDGPWFKRLDSQQTMELSMGTTRIGEAESLVNAVAVQPRVADMGTDPHAPGWIWGDLLHLSTGETTKQLGEIPAWIRELTMDDALLRYNRLASDPNMKFRDWVDLMRDWIRSHPEQIPALLAALADDQFEKRQAEPALFFALAESGLPEARVALLALMENRDYSGLNRSRAAVALASGAELPEGYVDRLISLSRGSGKGADAERDDVEGMSAVLGMVANRQKEKNPTAARKARADLFGRLESESEPWRVAAALTGVGNIQDDSILEPVEPFLSNEDPALRAIAASAMRGVSPEKASPIYGPMLETEKDPAVRHALVHAYHSQAVNARSGPTQEVLAASAKALGSESDVKVVRQLVELLGLASQRGDASAREALQGLMQSELLKTHKNLELLQLLGQYL